MNVQEIIPSQLAKNGEDYLALLDSDADWIVRSPEDLEAVRAAGDNIFAAMSDADFQSFSATLIFKSGGLAHANYEVLTKNADAGQVASAFRHFGISEELFTDYNNKECKSHGTCSPSPSDVCTSNC